MSEPWTPVCEKNQRFIANPGFNAKSLTMVLPRRHFFPASVFCASGYALGRVTLVRLANPVLILRDRT